METIETMTQYLTFTVDEEKFALNVANVREVLEYRSVTKVPKMPDFMKGVINLRGNVVPVIDLRLKFGIEATETTVDTSIIVSELEKDDSTLVMGLLTDSVEEVIDIQPETIEPPPRIGSKIDTGFIQGMGKLEEDFVIILNIQKILSSNELSLVDADIEKEEPEET